MDTPSPKAVGSRSGRKRRKNPVESGDVKGLNPEVCSIINRFLSQTPFFLEDVTIVQIGKVKTGRVKKTGKHEPKV